MIKYSIFLLTIVALAVFGLSKLATAQVGLDIPRDVTVIYQTASSEGSRPIVLERCAKEDCSDTAQ